MMTDKQIHARLSGIFREFFDEEDLDLKDSLSQDDIEDWDSMSHVNLIIRIEKEMKVKFSVAEVSAVKTVGDIKALLRKHKV